MFYYFFFISAILLPLPNILIRSGCFLRSQKHSIVKPRLAHIHYFIVQRLQCIHILLLSTDADNSWLHAQSFQKSIHPLKLILLSRSSTFQDPFQVRLDASHYFIYFINFHDCLKFSVWFTFNQIFIFLTMNLSLLLPLFLFSIWFYSLIPLCSICFKLCIRFAIYSFCNFGIIA